MNDTKLSDDAVEEIRLDIEKFFVSKSVTAEVLISHRFDVANYLLVAMRKMAVDKLEDFTYTHPDGLLQYLKLAVLPKWLIKRFPVRYFSIRHKADALYEKVQMPEHCTGFYQKVTKGKFSSYE